MYFLIEMQIITGLDQICCIQNTEKYKYNEYTKYIENINFHRAVDRLCVICCSSGGINRVKIILEDAFILSF